MYEVIKIDPGSYTVDREGVHHRVLSVTLHKTLTWAELMSKRNRAWFAGKGCVIRKDGEEIGTTEDLIEAEANAYDDRTGRAKTPTLRDFMAISNQNQEEKK